METKDDKMFEIMKGLADNAFECSNKFTTKCFHFLAGKLVITLLVIVIWLIVLTVKIF